LPPVKIGPSRLFPALIATGVIVAVWGARLLRMGSVEQLEWKTFDWRVRVAARSSAPVATNLGFVFMSDESITALNNGSLGYRFGLYWPRQIYGRLVRELSAQGARAVAFDVLFAELRPDHAPVPVSEKEYPDAESFLLRLHPGQAPTKVDGQILFDSDDYLAWQLRRAGNVTLASDKDLHSHDLFRTNAASCGDIPAEQDADGILRRARAFRAYRHWHPAFVQAAEQLGFNLREARIEPGQIILSQPDGAQVKVPLDAQGCFDLADFVGDKIPAGMARRAKPFTEERVWHMGILLAAAELRLDLAKAEVDTRGGRIVLSGTNGVRRVVPIDAGGFFHIDWRLGTADPRLTKEAIESLLLQDQVRRGLRAGELTNRWQGKLVVVGSTATGNDLTDRGSTPIEKSALLVSKHWNVANSVILGQFVQRTGLGTDFLLIALLGAATAFLTWRLHAFAASGSVLLLAAAYTAASVWLYVQHRLWVPLVLPLAGALLIEHVCLVTYRAVFEERERRRVKSVFSKLVSPNIVLELLGSKRLALGGGRREITVLFADVRGFTEFADRGHEQVAQVVRQQGLSGLAAEAVFDEQARETLQTVNLYLATVADLVKRHDGTLDKYIGDCVMAFWGAPTPNAKHALACVCAAIDIQRAIHELNQHRAAENSQREDDNHARAASGLAPQPLLPILTLGSGINTGTATVGLMGSDAHILNFTVFGREINLASRLESLSGHGRILIGEATFQALQRDDPGLAAKCAPLEPVRVKGFREAVKVHEVPWRTQVAPA
jgi:class 3 adenylate cyclase/CHASE2 domain-containing sensor protein